MTTEMAGIKAKNLDTTESILNGHDEDIHLNGATKKKQNAQHKKSRGGADSPPTSLKSPENFEKKDMLSRLVAVNKKKLYLHQEALALMQLKLDEDEEGKIEAEKQLKFLIGTIAELQTKVARMHKRISVQEAEIAKLNQSLAEVELSSKNGILIWEMDKYWERKEDAVSGKMTSIYSRTFKTSIYGYNLCARLYLNGDGVGKGTHLSLFIALKKGIYDSILTWPFRPRVTFRILNQAGKTHIQDSFIPDPQNISFQRPRKEMNVAAGCPKFAEQHLIESPYSGFLVNAKIFIMVKVDTSHLEF